MTGTIPAGISNFKALTELHLNDNNLATPLPSTFPSTLQVLTLSNNTALTGAVQGSFCTLPSLQNCDMRNTALTAPSSGCSVCLFGST